MMLRDELINDPAGLGYAAFLPASPGSVLVLMTERTGTMLKAISTETAQMWAAGGAYATIVDASNNAAHPCRASCLVLRQTLASGIDIHIEDPAVTAMLAAWVATSVCTAAQRDDLIARGMQPASRVEILGLGVVTIQQIIEAIK